MRTYSTLAMSTTYFVLYLMNVTRIALWMGLYWSMPWHRKSCSRPNCNQSWRNNRKIQQQGEPDVLHGQRYDRRWLGWSNAGRNVPIAMLAVVFCVARIAAHLGASSSTRLSRSSGNSSSVPKTVTVILLLPCLLTVTHPSAGTSDDDWHRMKALIS